MVTNYNEPHINQNNIRLEYYHVSNKVKINLGDEIDICTYENINSYLHGIVKFENVPKYIYVVEYNENISDIKTKYYIKTRSYANIYGPFSLITFIIGNFHDLIKHKHSFHIHEIRAIEIIKHIILNNTEYVKSIDDTHNINRNDLELYYNNKCHYDNYDVIIIMFNNQNIELIEHLKNTITDDDIKKRLYIILKNVIKHKQYDVAIYLQNRFSIYIMDLLTDNLPKIYSYNAVDWLDISEISKYFNTKHKNIYININNIIHEQNMINFIQDQYWILSLYDNNIFKYILKTGKYEAIKRGNISMIKWLYENCGFDKTYFRKNDNKLLKLANEYNQTEIYNYINNIIKR